MPSPLTQTAAAHATRRIPRSAEDWRLQIPEPSRRLLRRWLWAIVAVTAAILVIGGLTRLTQSGLSIVRWEPLMGVMPPIGEAQWLERFEQYRQFPEYRQLRQSMTLSEFKVIFFWEYLHRLLARSLGLVFLAPFLAFWLRGRLPRPLLVRTLALFGLGGAQGLMGWLMVASGLVDRPSVSHYRLAAHLSLALVIVGVATWMARDLSIQPARPSMPERTARLMRRGVLAVGLLLAVQIVWGALVAGLDAGLAFNTFPLMAGRLIPVQLFMPIAFPLSLLQNPPAVQWMHRLIGTLLLAAVIALAIRLRGGDLDRTSRRFGILLLAAIAGQYLLGVLTLLWAVPIGLGVAHQLAALGLVIVWVCWLHHAWHVVPSRHNP